MIENDDKSNSASNMDISLSDIATFNEGILSKEALNTLKPYIFDSQSKKSVDFANNLPENNEKLTSRYGSNVSISEIATLNEEMISNKSRKITNQRTLKSFTLASGSEILIKQKSIDYARQIVDKDDWSNSESNNNISLSAMATSNEAILTEAQNTKKPPSSFTFASGNKATVSKKSMDFARQIIDEEQFETKNIPSSSLNLQDVHSDKRRSKRKFDGVDLDVEEESSVNSSLGDILENMKGKLGKNESKLCKTSNEIYGSDASLSGIFEENRNELLKNTDLFGSNYSLTGMAEDNLKIMAGNKNYALKSGDFRGENYYENSPMNPRTGRNSVQRYSSTRFARPKIINPPKSGVNRSMSAVGNTSVREIFDIKEEDRDLLNETFNSDFEFNSQLPNFVENNHNKAVNQSEDYGKGTKNGSGLILPMGKGGEVQNSAFFKSASGMKIAVSEDTRENARMLLDTTDGNDSKYEENIDMSLFASGTMFELSKEKSLESAPHSSVSLSTKNASGNNYLTAAETANILKEFESCNFSSDMEETVNEAEIPQDSKCSFEKSHCQLSPIPSKGRDTGKAEYLISSTPAKRYVVTKKTSPQNLSATVLIAKETNSRDIKPSLGLFSRIRSGNVQLISMKELARPNPEGGVERVNDDGFYTVSFKNCVDIQFSVDSQCQSLTTDDGGIIYPTNDHRITIDQIVASFMALKTVDSKLITKEWLLNHYQMVLWKILTFQNSRGHCLSPNWMSPQHILLQLKYRYDKEIDCAKRPALRKISEGDTTPGRRLVLVVLCIERNGADISQVLLSDGWYYVPALLDLCLKNQIINGKIKVGMKLVTTNATWTGFDGPIVLPCSSFPPSSGIRLQGNSTRRARNYAKLGFQRNATPFLTSLGSLSPIGGLTSLISVVVNRIYPRQYMETVENPEGGKPRRIFRNEREEKIAETDFQKLKENFINKTVDSFFSNRSFSKRQRKGPATDLQTGEEILDWLNNSVDEESAPGQLSTKQHETLRAYKEKVVSDAIRTNCPNRNVISVARVLVTGLHPSDVDSKQGAMLTIWKPHEELMNWLIEGTSVRIYSLLVHHSRVDIHSTINKCSIDLKTTSTTSYELDKSVHENLVERLYRPRQLLSVNDACRILSTMAESCEIDCSGVVIDISTLITSTTECWQLAILGDPDSDRDDIIAIKLWGGLKQNILSNVVEVGACVKFMNLQFRKIFKSRKDAPDEKVAIPECHYSQYSGVVHVNKFNNIAAIKASLDPKVKKLLPWFKSLATDTSSIKPHQSVSKTPLKLTTPASLIRDPNSSNSSPRTLVSSTPKRLGLSSSKRINTSVTSLNESLDRPEKENKPVEVVAIDPPAHIAPEYVDDFDLNEDIADVVKTRRRLSTSTTATVPANKKKK